ncbi:MAG: hypothetical protein QG635_1952 [Bacteroidota bacterium]|nr:hypothetical protein [Bacteroidota bacterium]
MIESLKQISPFEWEIPQDNDKNMRTSARIYATKEMLELVKRDRSLNQLINVTSLPGIEGNALVMPDVHEGYGFPIGAVAAINYDDGVISPGGIGYDINCGVRLLKSELQGKDIITSIDRFANDLYKAVPSGMGKRGGLRLSQNQLAKVLETGVRWAVDEGYATEEDMNRIESNGSLTTADSAAVSKHAKERGYDQLGTMGSGNHFVEIDRVENIFDEVTADAFGLRKGQIVIQIHTGSRGLGHQVATDYIKEMIASAASFNISLPDRELCYAPLSSDLGKNYFAAMSASANFAWVNRQLISYQIRKTWENFYGVSGGKLALLYDVAHNIAKIEEHTIDNKLKKVIVHRKGATRAFPAYHPEIPREYQSVGQPVLIPGSMGTSSYILVGMKENMEHSFGSTCHGAGRVMSRTAATKKIQGRELFDSLTKEGISIHAGSYKGLAEEAPEAYKDVETVVDVVQQAGIAKKVARLKPLAVIKG